MIHFIENSFVVTQTDYHRDKFGSFVGVQVRILGSFNTRIRASKFIEDYKNSQQYKKWYDHRTVDNHPKIEVVESVINPIDMHMQVGKEIFSLFL